MQLQVVKQQYLRCFCTASHLILRLDLLLNSVTTLKKQNMLKNIPKDCWLYLNIAITALRSMHITYAHYQLSE